MLAAFIIVQGDDGLAGKRVERDEVEDGHQADPDIAEVPYHRVGLHAADQQHDQRQQLVQRLPEPAVAEKVGHIGAGIEQDAEEGGPR